MSEAAGTPEQTPAGGDTQKPGDAKDDSGQTTVSAQFKKEALESWKPKAEQYNKLEAELAQERARRQELEQIAYSGGIRQATDPTAEAYQQVLAQAEYDPVAKLAVLSAQQTAKANAELWLSKQVQDVPRDKREQVEAIIRNAGYQMSADQALKLVTDPESQSLHDKLKEMEAEIARLRTAKPNGVSPSSVIPASASADDGGTQETIKRSEYLATIQRAQQVNASDADKARARALMQAVGSNKTRMETD